MRDSLWKEGEFTIEKKEKEKEKKMREGKEMKRGKERWERDDKELLSRPLDTSNTRVGTVFQNYF